MSYQRLRLVSNDYLRCKRLLVGKGGQEPCRTPYHIHTTRLRVASLAGAPSPPSQWSNAHPFRLTFEDPPHRGFERHRDMSGRKLSLSNPAETIASERLAGFA